MRSLSIVPSLLLGCLPLAANAEAILDQAYEGTVGTPASVGFFQGLDRAQTFTVGVSGRLLRAELMLSRTPPPGPVVVDVVDLELRATTPDGRPLGGLPIGLASSVSTNDLDPQPAWIAFEFSSAGIPVTAGERLALVVRAPFLEFPDGASWAGTVGDAGYGGGAGFLLDGDGFVPQAGGFDGNFRTYVEAPEPTAATGTAAALLALRALVARRDRRLG